MLIKKIFFILFWSSSALSLTVENACQISEKWADKKEFSSLSLPHSFESGAKNLFFAYEQITKKRNYSERFAARYIIARSLDKMGLKKEAATHFMHLFLHSSDSHLSLAALSCFHSIKKKLSALTFPLKAIEKLEQMPEKNHPDVLFAAFSLFHFKLISSDPQIEKERQILSSHPAYHSLSEGLLAIFEKRYQDAEPFFKAFLKHPDPNLNYLVPHVQKLLWMTHYNRKDYLTSSPIVKNNYNATQLFSLQGWSHLHKMQIDNAASDGFNMISASLKKSFSLEGWILTLISYFEMCDYPKMKQQIDQAEKAILPTYKMLYRWNVKEQQGQPENYYHLFKKAAHGSNLIPAPIVAEWVRSYLVISLQKEINAILDEQDLKKKIAKIAMSSHKISDAAWKRLKKEMMSSSDRELSALTQKINNALRHQNVMMLKMLKEPLANLKFLKIDLLQKTANLIRASQKEQEEKKNFSSAKSSSAKLSFGSFLFGSDDSEEFWEDEKYHLQVHLENLCKDKSPDKDQEINDNAEKK